MTQNTEDEELSQNSQYIDFGHLEEILQPVRDVSAMWNVPLREYLDEFLEKIRGEKLTVDNLNAELVNFSQAGLFLQRSTDIYSKKVKDLYQLCLNMKAHGIEENENEEKTKRKRKIVEYVDENNYLILLTDEDFETGDIDCVEDNERLEITTRTKIPFCVLKSLDNKTNTEEPNYRLSTPPNDHNFAIFLDKSQENAEFDTHSFNDIPDDDEMHETDADDIENDNFVPSLDPIEQGQNIETGGEAGAETAGEPGTEAGVETDALQNPEIPDHPEEIESVQLPDIDSDHEVIEEVAEEEDKEEFEEKIEISSVEQLLLDPDARDEAQHVPMHVATQEERINMIKKGMDHKKKEVDKMKFSKPFNAEFQEYFDQLKKYRKVVERMRKAKGEIPADNENSTATDSFYETDYEPNIPDIDSESAPPDFDNSSDYADPSIDPRYDNKCRSFIKNMLTYGKEVINKNKNRMHQDWEKKILNILSEEEKRPKYDAASYNEWVLKVLKESGGRTTFKRLCSGRDRYEIGAVLLAVLVKLTAEEIVFMRNLEPSNFELSLTEFSDDEASEHEDDNIENQNPTEIEG